MQFGSYFGFGDLQPIELVDLEYQIAQTPRRYRSAYVRHTTWSTCNYYGALIPI